MDCTTMQEVQQGVHTCMHSKRENLKYHFGMRGYRWGTVSFGIVINLKNNTDDGPWYPNLAVDFWKYGFIVGWDIHEFGEGSTLS